MRILAVRGCNLTSLDGPFAVDFDREPLRRAGLFAITGPTGAGKSTILDALCLALFDRVPRLPEGNGVLLGLEGDPNAIRSTDVRAILRRGAGSGWAEVDFVGVDGASYRARWEVRRARLKARGKFQDQDISLSSLDGALRFGDKKKGVLEEIERRLGLTFEQFRRAVLLAQGDFATFLKAPAKDRSALLELLTGTEIYSRLSIAAHEREGQERRTLDALVAQGGGIGVLNNADRAALEDEAATADRAVRDGEQAVEAVRAAVAWHARDAQFAAAGQEAALAADSADGAWREAADRRATANLLRRLHPLRPLLADADRSATDAAEADAAVARSRLALVDARQAVEEAALRHAEARQRFEQTSQAQQDAEPDLARAADLDGRIAALAAELAAAVHDRDVTTQKAAAASESLQRSEQALGTARDAVGGLEATLHAEAALAPVVAQWSRWDAVLLRHADAARAHKTAAADAVRHGKSAATLATETARDDDERDATRIRLNSADETLARIQSEAVPSLDIVRQTRTAAGERRDRLTALAGLADASSRLDRAVSATEADERRLRDEIAHEQGAAVATATRLQQRRAALGEAEATLQRLRLSEREDVESLRARLVEGDPCPVCGSAAHPWTAAVHAPLARIAREQDQRVAALTAEVAALLTAHGGHEAAARTARGALEAVTTRLAADRGEAAALAARWADEAAAFGFAPLPEAEAVRAMLADVDTALAEAARDEALALDHRRRLDTAQGTQRELDAALNRLTQRFEDRRRRLDKARHAQAMAELRRDQAAEERDAALGELAEPLAGCPQWGAALAADSSAFRAAMAEQVAAYQTQREALATAGRAMEAAAADRIAGIASQDAARHAMDAAAQRVDGLVDRLAQLRGERGTLLEGQPVATLRQALSDRRHEASARLDHATVARQDATARLSAAEREVDTHAEAARRCAAKALAAADALDRAAAGCGVAVAEARQRLALPEAELAAEEAALAELDTARRDAGLLVAERRRQRQEHHANGVPTTDAAESEAALARRTEALAADRLRLGTARGGLNADDGNRARLAGLTVAIGEQRARHGLWAAMAQLIGSATGHKMRNFAQSLSLDLLLTHANRHLEELARRYRLERVAGADLDIQVVDREMGDERRGVHSLSGGELFLVSLALALGLSAMAAGTAGGIGTLFIDEGFGTLDPDSLDIALSCLEALQAGGRQVGVISHVPAMVERIGVQIRVVPLGGGRSRVAVLSTAATLPALADPEPAGT